MWMGCGERAVRVVAEVPPDCASRPLTITAVVKQSGGRPQAVYKWARTVKLDGGIRPGSTTEELAEMPTLAGAGGGQPSGWASALLTVPSGRRDESCRWDRGG